MIGDSLWSMLTGWRRPGGRFSATVGMPTAWTARFPVGVGALIKNEHGHILLVQNSYQRPPSWMPPGGWLGSHETPQQAVAREVHEELGLHVRVGRPLKADVNRSANGYGEVGILFACEVIGNGELCLSDEIARAEYFDTALLPPLSDAVRRWISGEPGWMEGPPGSPSGVSCESQA